MDIPAAPEACVGKRADQGRKPDDPLPGGTGIYRGGETGGRSAYGPQLAGKPVAGRAEKRETGSLPNDI